MKNIFFKSAALIAALAMTMSGCSNEELTGDNGQTGEMKGISSITLETPQGGPSTRLEYNTDNITQALGVKWRAGKWENANSDCERALVLNANYNVLNGAILARSDDGAAMSKAEFKFYDFKQKSGLPMWQGSIGLLYPYKSDYSAAFNLESTGAFPVEATLPLSGQTGMLANMQNFDYMTAIAAIENDDTATDANLNITFKHRIAIMRLTGLTFPAGTTGTATNISISATGLKTDAKLTLTSDINNMLTESLVLGSTEGAIATTGSFNITNNVLGDVYICFFPGNADATGTHQITGLKVTATVSSDTYEYNYGADATVTPKVTKFEEGKMYTLKGKPMTKKVADYIEVSGIKVAIGNLVANGANDAKIGVPTDGGLYFQFGSLIGWAGGATGDGTGVPASNASYAFNVAGAVVPTGQSVPTTWDDPGKWTGTTGDVPAEFDPCTHYLGSPWRLPTKSEYETLFGSQTEFSATSSPWSWTASPASATHIGGLTFPASGCRAYGGGSLAYIGTHGYCWSASPSNDSNGHNLVFYSSGMVPNGSYSRVYGLPVRCVQNASN